MLNFMNANPTPQPYPLGAPAAPFAWLPVGIAFFRRQRRPILGGCAIGLALGLAYLAMATPQFTAIATITIDTRRAHPVGGQQATADWQSENAYVESQVELIRSPATLRGVVAQQRLALDPLFAPTEVSALAQVSSAIRGMLPMLTPAAPVLDPAARAEAMAILALSRMVEVWRVGATSVVEVRLQSPDRALSARLANAVTAAYMAQQLVAISETTQRAGGWLQGRIAELRGQAVAADRAVQEYKAANNIIDVGTGAGIGQMNEQQLGELNLQVATARARVAEAQARYKRAQDSTVGGVIQGVVSDVGPNSVMTRLRQQYSDATRREAELTARQGPKHGAVILQHNEVVELQRSIQSELARLTETYRGDFEVAQANLTAIQARLSEQVTAAVHSNIERSELRSLQSSADAYRQIYETFLQRFTQAMQDQSYPISDARVAAAALPPIDRSQPRSSIALAVSLFAGLLLGLLLAVVREALDDSVHSASELRQATGLDCLGIVAETGAKGVRRGWRARRASRQEASLGRIAVPIEYRQAAVHPDSAVADAVHGVRVAAARQSARGRNVRVIGCVSVLGDEGTSSFAANLALALAVDGQRTVLVDWNAGTPALTDILAPGVRMGVQDLAMHDAVLADVALTDPVSGLRFIGQSRGRTAGTEPGAARLRALLADLRDRHDIIILDLPPIQSGNATVRMCDMVDAFVLVTRWNRTPQSVLVEALSRVAAMDAFFLGAVLSHCDTRRMRLYPDAVPATRMVANVPAVI